MDTLNLEEEILKEHSKRQTVRLAEWIGGDRGRFGQLMALFLRGEYRVTQRSAWIVSQCADAHPELITPWLGPMIRRMQEPGTHDAVRRNVIRIFQFTEIPRRLQGKTATVCFEYLGDPGQPVAVKCNSMTVLTNMALKEPHLAHELRIVVEQILPYSTAAFRARAKKTLKVLSKSPQATRRSVSLSTENF
jgi:hypothetical protein